MMDAGQLRWMIDFLRNPPGGLGTAVGRTAYIKGVSYAVGGPVAVHPIQITSVNYAAIGDLLKARDAVLKRKFLR